MHLIQKNFVDSCEKVLEIVNSNLQDQEQRKIDWTHQSITFCIGIGNLQYACTWIIKMININNKSC